MEWFYSLLWYFAVSILTILLWEGFGMNLEWDWRRFFRWGRDDGVTVWGYRVGPLYFYRIP